MEFTKRCKAYQIPDMGTAGKADTLKQIRTVNLGRVIEKYTDDNVSELARAYAARHKTERGPPYFNELRSGKKPSFGEKAARRIEEALGLVPGCMDIADSPLPRIGQAADTRLNRLNSIWAELSDKGRELVFNAAEMALAAKKPETFHDAPVGASIHEPASTYSDSGSRSAGRRRKMSKSS